MALARGLIGYAPAVVVPRLVTLLQVTLLTRCIAPAEFGVFILVITLGDVIDALCCNWIRIMLGRYGAGRSQAVLAEEATRSLLLFGGVTVLFAMPGAALASMVQHGGIAFFLSLAAYLATNGAARLALTVLSTRGLKVPFFIVEAIRTLVGFAAVMALAWTGLATTAPALLMAMNAATALAAVIGLALSFRGLAPRQPRGWAVERAAYAGPLVIGTLVTVLLNSSDRLVVERFAGPAALATYAAAIMLARQPLEFLFSIVNVRTFPELMAIYETEGARVAGEHMGDLISVMALLTAPAAIGLALVADPLARTFLAADYVEAARTIIPLGAVAGLMLGFKHFVFDLPLHMKNAVMANTLMVLPASLAGLLVSALLAARIGPVGCVLGLLVQCALVLGIGVVQARRLIPIVLNRRDLGRIALMCAAMTVAVSASLALLAGAPAAVRLACAIGVGGGFYVAAGLLLKPGPVRDLLQVGRVETA